ncbi:MAG: hypothetical protein ACRCZ0_11495 [Cetobacterium sp.]
MAIVDFKRLKEASKTAKDTHLIDLGKYIDKALEGIILPIRVKSIEEGIKLKQAYKEKSGKLTIEYKSFSRTPKAFREMYMKTDDYRRGVTETTYFQFCRVDTDNVNIEVADYRDRLFNILIHIDFDYKTEEDKTLWEETGLKPNDYVGVVDLFSDILVYSIHLDKFDLVIDKIKSGVLKEEDIVSSMAMLDLKHYLDSNYKTEEEKTQAFKDIIEASAKLSQEGKSDPPSDSVVEEV